MMNVLLIAWTFVAACASFVIGAWIAVVAPMQRWPGLVVMVLAAVAVGLGVQLCRERVRRIRPMVSTRHEHVPRKRTPQPPGAQGERPTGQTLPRSAAGKKQSGLGRSARKRERAKQTAGAT